jgi:hypothetical protein
MAAPEVEEFARLLIAHVRDRAVAECDMALDANSSDVMALRWRQKLQTGGVGDFVAEIIPDCVDDTLFYLLNAIDQGLLKISFTAASGKTVDLTEIGESEMSGWYMATKGWRAAYSKERFNDDFADLV